MMVFLFLAGAISVILSHYLWKFLEDLLLIELVLAGFGLVQVGFQSVINILVWIFLLFFDGFFDVSDVEFWETLDDHLIEKDDLNFVESLVNIFGLVR